MIDAAVQGSTPTSDTIKAIDDWMAANTPGWQLNNYNGSGTTTSQLEGLAKGFGSYPTASAFSHKTCDLLVSELTAGRPVIVTVDTQSGNDWPSTTMKSSGHGHFMVVVGIDDSFVYLNDPGRSKAINGCGADAESDCKGRKFTLSSFEAIWAKHGHTGVTIKSGGTCLCGDGKCESQPGCDENCASCEADCACTGSATCNANGQCIMQNSCAGITCSNHGQCMNGACSCNPCFGGALCDQCSAGCVGYPNCIGDPCIGNNCSGHGVCSNQSCTCNPGYQGSQCDSCAPGYSGYPNCMQCSCNGGTCCSNGCTPDPAGTPCNDGNQCTANDSCNGAGTCTGAAAKITTASLPLSPNCSAGNPAACNWTAAFVANTNCTCDVAHPTCHDLYRAAVIAISPNGWQADIAFEKADGTSIPAGRQFWFGVTAAPPDCNQLGFYATHGQNPYTVQAQANIVVVQGVPVWTSQAAYDADPQGTQKNIFVISDGANNVGQRVWFEKDAIAFTKSCP